MKKIELEFKFPVGNAQKLFEKIGGAPPKIAYILDEVYGSGKGFKEEKIRKRLVFSGRNKEIIYEKTKWLDGKIKKVRERKIKTLSKNLKLENSYEKIRFLYIRQGYEICIDFYPIGVFCEIEGKKKNIKKIAKKLGFNLKDNIEDNIDAYYVKKFGEEKAHWRFGSF
ncbi:MAG: hypothetical protein NTZ84_01370 [Candidatus Nealsonbacteria bacterium]|nr:hypothetical protein [Candidatus Nealsonbacteria bacterium]